MSNSFKTWVAVLAVIAMAVILTVLWLVTGNLILLVDSEPAIALLWVARLSMLVFGIFFGALLLCKDVKPWLDK